MNPITRDLATAHISELRRQACSFQCGCIQRVRTARRHRRVLHRPSFTFLPFEAGLFRHP
jgi:hypothetical protein